MNFEQPQGVPTKAEIDATIDALRVQISDKQAEIVRQQTIIDSNRYTTQQLSNEKAELTDKIEKLTVKKGNLEKDIEGLEKQKEIVQEQVEAARTETAQKVTEMEIRLKAVQVEEAELETKKGIFAITNAKLVADQLTCEAKEKILNEKLKKLEDIINS